MVRRTLVAALMVLAVFGSGAGALAQSAAGPSGHWEGAIQIPGQELKIQVDLARAGEKWEGTIDIPVQGLKAFPLGSISVQGAAVTFAMPNVPGSPQFSGTVATEGTTLAGEFTQGGGSVPFSLTRTGEAKIQRPPDSTPVTKELEGAWEGTLNVNGTMLRLVLVLANQPGGAATASLVSVDQGASKVPIAAVVQSGTHLKLVIPVIAGNFEGDLKDGELAGTWTQGPGSLPLVFRRQK